MRDDVTGSAESAEPDSSKEVPVSQTSLLH